MRSISSICGLAILLAASTPVAASDEYVVAGSIAGADGGWDFASVDPETNRLFVARSNGVTAVDLATRKVTDILVEGAGVHGVSPIPGTPFAISANGKSANALLFDKLTGKIEATFPTGQGPDAIVVEPKSGLVVIFNGKSHDATLVDVTSKSVVGAIALDGKPEVGARRRNRPGLRQSRGQECDRRHRCRGAQGRRRLCVEWLRRAHWTGFRPANGRADIGLRQ